MLRSDKTIEIIKRIISEQISESEIILFGSRARKDNSSKSDFDLMIVVSDDLNYSDRIDLSCKITSLLAKEKIPADVLIKSREEVNVNKFHIGSVVREALKEGVIL